MDIKQEAIRLFNLFYTEEISVHLGHMVARRIAKRLAINHVAELIKQLEIVIGYKTELKPHYPIADAEFWRCVKTELETMN